MTMRATNPYAPPSINGIGQAGTPGDYRDVSFDYTFNATIAAGALQISICRALRTSCNSSFEE